MYDIFAATEAEFRMIFARGEDTAFIDEVVRKNRSRKTRLHSSLARVWARRIPQCDVVGIHVSFFMSYPKRKRFTQRDGMEKP